MPQVVLREELLCAGTVVLRSGSFLLRSGPDLCGPGCADLCGSCRPDVRRSCGSFLLCAGCAVVLRSCSSFVLCAEVL